VAAWGLSGEELKAVVGTVKRSPLYRAICGELQARCPRDVWIDDGIGFVHFDAGVTGDGPAWFVFAVDLDAREVVGAKRLAPDEKGHEIFVTELEEELVPRLTICG
jgi:hypothetical protein